jgi:hypothetical protein
MRDRNNRLCGNAVSCTRMNFSRIPTKDKRSSKVHVVDYTYSSDFRNTVVCKQYIAYDTPRYTVLFHDREIMESTYGMSLGISPGRPRTSSINSEDILRRAATKTEATEKEGHIEAKTEGGAACRTI